MLAEMKVKPLHAGTDKKAVTTSQDRLACNSIKSLKSEAHTKGQYPDSPYSGGLKTNGAKHYKRKYKIGEKFR